MDVTDFEDKRWSDWKQSFEFRHRAALACIADGTVLDIGCGDGLLLSALRERGIEAEGIDISPEAIARGREQGLAVHLFDPAASLPYPDGAFDTVVLLDVLEHTLDPKSLLAEAARVARTRVIAGVPNFSSLPARMQVMGGRVPENNRPHKGHVYWFNWPVLNGIAQECGLEIRSCRMNTFAPFSLFGEAVVHSFPNLLALSFVAELQRTS